MKKIAIVVIVLVVCSIMKVSHHPATITVAKGEKGKIGGITYFNKGKAADAEILFVLTLSSSLDTNMLFIPLELEGTSIFSGCKLKAGRNESLIVNCP